MYILKCNNSINNSILQYRIDKTKMFSPPDTQKYTSTISINIPQIANKPLPTNITISNISRIILCLNNQIDNSVMLNTLRVRVYDLNNNVITKWYVSEIIDPATNFLTLVLPSSYPITTKANSSNFANVKKNRSNFVNLKNALKFVDVVAKPDDVVLSALILVPTTTQPTTTQPTTTQPLYGQTTTTQPLYVQPTTTQPLSNNNALQNKIKSSPSTKLFQRNFKGTSNVYSPAIYNNVEKFVPLNSLDEYYATY